MPDYRVNLDFYNGPLDLLLYLIRRDELDIYDVPISRITGQYLQYVEMIHELDPNLAGEFLVLAATLMEIKTRMLLPSPPPEEGGEQGLGIDPRTELVRQLLEYKAFKDAAGDLADAAHTRAQKFARRPFLPEHDPAELDLDNAQVWDLLDAFSRLMTSIGKRPGQHEVIYDDTPVELHATDIMDRLRREGPLTFDRIFEGRTNRGEIVGLFIALLELVRQKKIFVAQERIFGRIEIHRNPNPPTGDEENESSDSGDANRGTGVSPLRGVPPVLSDDDRRDARRTLKPDDIIAGDQRRVDSSAGRYVPDSPSPDAQPDATEKTVEPGENDNEPGAETQGTAN